MTESKSNSVHGVHQSISIIKLVTYLMLVCLVMIWYPLLDNIYDNLGGVSDYLVFGSSVLISGIIGVLIRQLAWQFRFYLVIILSAASFLVNLIWVDTQGFMILDGTDLVIACIRSAFYIISFSVVIFFIEDINRPSLRSQKIDNGVLLTQTALAFGIVIPIVYDDVIASLPLGEIIGLGLTVCLIIVIWKSGLLASDKKMDWNTRHFVVSLFSPYAWFYGLAFIGVAAFNSFLYPNPADIISNILKISPLSYVIENYVILILICAFLAVQVTTNLLFQSAAKKYRLVNKKNISESEEEDSERVIDWKREAKLFIARVFFVIVLVILVGGSGFLVYIFSDIPALVWVNFCIMIFLANFLVAFLFQLSKNWYFDQF